MNCNTQQIAERINIQAKDQSVGLRKMYYDLGLSHGTVPHIAKGEKLPYQDLFKIADYLDCSVDYLLGRTDNPKSHIEKKNNNVEIL